MTCSVRLKTHSCNLGFLRNFSRILLNNNNPYSSQSSHGLPSTLAAIQEKSDTPPSYDFLEMFKGASCTTRPRLRCQEFVSPNLNWRQISCERGRGLMAESAFAAGEILAAEKAVEVVYESEVEVPDLFMQMDSKVLTQALVLRLIALFAQNPGLAEDVLQLSPRPDFDSDLDSEANRAVGQLNPARVEAIVRTNAFALASNAPRGDIAPSAFGLGLWFIGSLMNHSCLYNAYPVCYGDFMVVRAVRPIARGEEITISYGFEGKPLEARRQAAAKYSFACDCRRCRAEEEFEKTNSIKAAQRRAFLGTFADFYRIFRAKPTEQMLQLLEAYLLQYKRELALPEFDGDYVRLLRCLAAGYEGLAQFHQAAELYAKAFVAAFASDGMDSIRLGLQTMRCFKKARKAELALLWYSKAKERFKIVYGSDDLQLMALAYPSFAVDMRIPKGS